MKRPVQYFTPAYLEQCRKMSPEEILGFLEDFRLMAEPAQRSVLISLKIPQRLLGAFKQRCSLAGIPYQRQIKRLMREWLDR